MSSLEVGVNSNIKKRFEEKCKQTAACCLHWDAYCLGNQANSNNTSHPMRKDLSSTSLITTRCWLALPLLTAQRSRSQQFGGCCWAFINEAVRQPPHPFVCPLMEVLFAQAGSPWKWHLKRFPLLTSVPVWGSSCCETPAPGTEPIWYFPLCTTFIWP